MSGDPEDCRDDLEHTPTWTCLESPRGSWQVRVDRD
jgi:hypothetical protein